jgi:hypothetical protein
MVRSVPSWKRATSDGSETSNPAGQTADVTEQWVAGRADQVRR